MTFRVARLRFGLRARGPVVFPSGKAGNVFRGAFGMALREVCPAADYERLFEPSASGAGPSGLADRPRPFVVRAAALDGRRFEPGDQFAFDVHVFDAAAVDPLRRACAHMGAEGIGPGRGSFEFASPPRIESVDLDLATPVPAASARVEFVTPTELKAAGEVCAEPEFAVLVSRLRDRISTLRHLYQGGPIEIDFRGFAERAATVRRAASSLRHETVERFSTRTHQVHPLGGIIGWIDYEGELGEFIPYLRAGFWTGVGRQTVWGKGVITCRIPASIPTPHAP